MADPDGGVQSVERALTLLETLAKHHEAVRLADLETATGLPLPTIHRLMKSLLRRGYVRQEPSRRYSLGSRLVHLGDLAGASLGAAATHHLQRVVDRVGETTNLAKLEGDAAVYVNQVPSSHSVRMFTQVGRRVDLHSTGVGKALLSQLPDKEVLAILDRVGMPAQTNRTITSPDALLAELSEIREQGWAVDNAEHEEGVRCVAAPVPHPARLAISISGPSGRVTVARLPEIGAFLQQVANELVDELWKSSAVPGSRGDYLTS